MHDGTGTVTASLSDQPVSAGSAASVYKGIDIFESGVGESGNGYPDEGPHIIPLHLAGPPWNRVEADPTTEHDGSVAAERRIKNSDSPQTPANSAEQQDDARPIGS